MVECKDKLYSSITTSLPGLVLLVLLLQPHCFQPWPSSLLLSLFIVTDGWVLFLRFFPPKLILSLLTHPSLPPSLGQSSLFGSNPKKKEAKKKKKEAKAAAAAAATVFMVTSPKKEKKR